MNVNEIKQMVVSLSKKHGNDPSHLIAIMQEVQQTYNYLPKEALEEIALSLGISIAKVYSVATFYENFSLQPKGKHIIRVCDGTACHVRKSISVLNALKSELKLKDGQNTTDDMNFTIETVSCLGACGLAPVITIDEVVYPAMTPETAKELIGKIREEESANE